jgi:hypothetical protein
MSVLSLNQIGQSNSDERTMKKILSTEQFKKWMLQE